MLMIVVMMVMVMIMIMMNVNQPNIILHEELKMPNMYILTFLSRANWAVQQPYQKQQVGAD